MDMIGLTGGIASGKSTVAQWLRSAQVPVIDADELAREAVKPGSEALQEIIDAFGPEAQKPDGTLDRAFVGTLVFQNEDARHQLNRIVHPKVAELAQRKVVELAAAGHARVVYEVPLLFENQLDRAMAATILVAVPRSTQIERLMARDGCSQTEAERRIDAQMPVAEKRQRASYVIENQGDLQSTAQQLVAVWRALTGETLLFSL